MGNAAICGINLADLGRIGASSQVLAMSSGLIQSPHVEQRWRAQTNAASFVVDLLSLQEIDTIALRGLTMGSNGTVRLRASSADASGEAGDILDLAVAQGSQHLDTRYGALTYLFDDPEEVRYIRFDLYDPDALMVECGRAFVGLRTAFTYNFAYGWQVQWVDRSTRQKSRGGQTLTWQDNKYRVLDLSFEHVTEDQRFGIVEEIDRDNGLTQDVFVITDTASANLARDSILGLVSDITPVIQPVGVWDANGPLYAKQYKIEERL